MQKPMLAQPMQSFRAAEASTYDVSDAFYSFYLTTGILTLAILLSEELMHWYVLPVYVCGVLIGVDMVRAVRAKIGLFEPVALIGFVGYHFFFLSPLLHTILDTWMEYIVPPADWRPWLGRMALLNALGIGIYLTARTWIVRKRAREHRKQHWTLDGRAFWRWLLVLMALSASLQLWFYFRIGGIAGYIQAYESQSGEFRGMGLLFALSEGFPILFIVGFAVWAAKRRAQPTWATLLLVLLVFILLRIVFGGLQGSRGTIIWSMYWALGLIHIWVRPVARKALLIFAVGGLLFMYITVFYKEVGTDFLSVFTGRTSFATLEENTGRTFDDVLLGDLSRSNVQAFMIYQLSDAGNGLNYQYAHGETYLSALLLPVPESILSVELTSKIDAGTEVLQGGSESILGDQPESRVYGIAGEALLNFGLWAIPIAFLVLGMIVGWAQVWRAGLASTDSRLLLAPFVSVLAFYPLVWDLDNVLVFATQYGLIPVALVVLTSQKKSPDSMPSSRE